MNKDVHIEVEEIYAENENPHSKCSHCFKCSTSQNSFPCLNNNFTSTLKNAFKLPSSKSLLVYFSIFLLFAATYLTFRSELVMGVMTGLLTKLEDQDMPHSILIFSVCFLFVSLPFTWGYIVFNLAAGYFHGFAAGVMVTAFTVMVATSLNHFICKHLFSNLILSCIRRRYDEAKLQALLRVLDGPSGIKIISLLRLTPIPFGLQNGLIAMSNIPVRHFMLASTIGLLPTQLINCYISSNFRSIQQITDSEGGGGYVLVVIQIVAGIALTKFVLKKAKSQLDEALQENSEESDEEMNMLGDKRSSSEESIPVIVVQQP